MTRIKIPQKHAGKFSLPVIGLGTWGMGGWYERDKKNDDERDILALRSAFDLGVRHFDTAEIYAEGYCEELVGRAIQKLPRAELIIASKVRPEHFRYDDLISACRGSLARLQTDYLDLYLLHAPNHSIPIKETMHAMTYLQSEGLIKNIGVSNFHHRQIEEAQTYSDCPIVNNQINYSLSAREWGDIGTLDYCENNDVLVTAYRPLSKGDFAGKGNDLLDKMSAKYRKTPAQIALNWVINKSNTVTLVKSSEPKHLEEDLGAIGWQMDAEDIIMLNNDFPRGEMSWGPTHARP